MGSGWIDGIATPEKAGIVVGKMSTIKADEDRTVHWHGVRVATLRASGLQGQAGLGGVGAPACEGRQEAQQTALFLLLQGGNQRGKIPPRKTFVLTRVTSSPTVF